MISDMGFNAAQARKALRETVSSFIAPSVRKADFPNQDGNPERAIEWLFSNPDDAGEEPSIAPAASSTTEPDIGGSSKLPANYRLKGLISHKGPSVHSGHYVATIRQPQAGLPGVAQRQDEWFLFNDEKVVRAPPGGGDEMRSLAYLYIFERI